MQMSNRSPLLIYCRVFLLFANALLFIHQHCLFDLLTTSGPLLKSAAIYIFFFLVPSLRLGILSFRGSTVWSKIKL